MLTLDNLAHRYGMLPSEALARADTLDLYVLDLGARWSNHQYELSQKNSGQPSTPNLTQEQMKAMINRVKERKNASGID